ncbi:MAG TPA: DUF4383 domain-containing protein [Candidatus Paceibacterota bacterium]
MVKKINLILGIVLIIIAIWGFASNMVLGVFEVGMWHNLVHLITGILALIFAFRGEASGRAFLKVIGIIYLLVAIIGFFTPDGSSILGFIEANNAGDWLHLVLAIIFLWGGFGGSKKMGAPMGGSGMGGGQTM